MGATSSKAAKGRLLIIPSQIYGESTLLVERNLLISALKLTKNGAINQEDIKSDAKIPSSAASFLLKKLQLEGLIYLKDGLVEIPADSRLKLAVRALQLGSDVEQVSDLLHWQEFESMASIALEHNGYVTAKNVHFKNAGKRWEIDVVGCQKPLVICVDCKQWHHGMHLSSLRKIVDAQSTRVAAFAESLPSKALDLPCTKWRAAVFVPVILSLIHVCVKFCDEVPVVPVLAFQDFIHQLPLNLDAVKSFPRKFEHL